MALSQDALDLGFGAVHSLVSRRADDELIGSSGRGVDDARAETSDGHHHAVVLILAYERRAFRREETHDCVRRAPHANRAPNRILRTEQAIVHQLTDQTPISLP